MRLRQKGARLPPNRITDASITEGTGVRKAKNYYRGDNQVVSERGVPQSLLVFGWLNKRNFKSPSEGRGFSPAAYGSRVGRAFRP